MKCLLILSDSTRLGCTFITGFPDLVSLQAVKELCSEDIVMSDTTLWPDPFCGQAHVVRVIEEYMTAFKLFRYTYVQALGSPDGKEVCLAAIIHSSTPGPAFVLVSQSIKLVRHPHIQ
jgi:hypothetical protein